MGLLEEAIREHLELQRRHGADPHVVERAEQEALQPLVPGQTPAWAEGPALFDQRDPLLEASSAAMAENHVSADTGPAPPSEFAGARVHHERFVVTRAGSDADPNLVEQETAELDMSTVLGEVSSWQDSARRAPASSIPEFGPVRARRIVSDHVGDFEWEVPDRSPQPPVQPSPRRGSFAFE
jgi:hypothetical protein